MKRAIRASFMRGFVVALLSIAWAVGFMPTPAFAACPDDTSSWIVKTQGTADNEYGVMVGQNLVINPSTDCGIVRSIYVKDSLANLAEVGWFEDDGPGGFHFTACQHFGSPHVLVYAVVNGTAKCKQDPPAVSASDPNYSFSVQNPDHDTDFAYYYDDDNTPNIYLGFFSTIHTNGYAQTATERKEAPDSLRATFVPFDSLGSGGGWHSYPGAFLASNPPVGGWEVCSWSGLNLDVKSTC